MVENGGRLRVLVVDDDADTRETLARLVRAWGHEAVSAEDGLAALRAAAASPPDVVLLDLRLPRVDGYEVARRLHQRATPKRPFVITLTGSGAAEARRRAAEAGADVHLLKPADPGVLERLLGRMGQILAGPTDTSGRQLN
jgi:CheY-like chemotaxis protein